MLMRNIRNIITGLSGCLLFFSVTNAQTADPQVVAAAGATSKAISGYTIDFTVGEAVITTAGSNTTVLTQGFNQPLRVEDYPMASLTLTGTAKSNYIQLDWTTTTETNNAWFYIERSADGIGFETIDSVATKAPNGTSTSPLNYTYADLQPLSGNNYYRLRQVNAYGSIQYSATIMVNFTTAATWRVQVYPNPVSHTLHLKLFAEQATRAKIYITGINGQIELYKFIDLPAGYSDQTIEVSRFTPGVYILSVRELFTRRRLNVTILKQ